MSRDNIETNGCPCCGSQKSASITGRTDSGYGCLLILKYGSVYLDLCLNCGCVFIDKERLASIKKQRGDEG